MKIINIVFFLVLTPLLVFGEEIVVGYLEVPTASRIDVKRKGDGKPVLVGGKQGEVWYDEESYRKELRKFEVFSSPDSKSSKIVSVDVSGVTFTLETESETGYHSFKGIEEYNKYQSGKQKLLVYEKKDNWVKVKFRDIPPWNGQYGWVELGTNTGGYISR